jgi:branched-chain amino acid transport system ATP-binding protein
MTTDALTLNDVSKSFGGVAAVGDVSFGIRSGEVTALIGPNGAGKTTLINLITGVLSPSKGNFVLAGEDISRLPMHARAMRGMARTYQTPQIIQGMSVIENVMTGGHRLGTQGVFASLLRPWSIADENRRMARLASECLKRVALPSEWWNQIATDLPYGHQRRVEIARALAQEPKVILLDEPAAGLNPRETVEISHLLKSIAQDGRAILLVEHDMPMVMSIAARIVVVNFGRRIATGTPSEISANPDVITAYLGTDEDMIEKAPAS